MCLSQMTPGWWLPSRSSCRNWRRSSNKCKEGLCSGVHFSQVSASLVIRTSSKNVLPKSLPAKMAKAGLSLATVFWFVSWAPGTGGSEAGRTEGWMPSLQAGYGKGTCPLTHGSLRPPSNKIVRGHLGIWRHLPRWEIHSLLLKLLIESICC